MKLSATFRQVTGHKVRQLRQAGQVPAVVYGHGFDNTNITLTEADFAKVLAAAGESTLIELRVDQQEPYKVLIQDVQRDPLTDRFTHVDLRRVKLDEKIEAEIRLEFIGIAPAVKEQGGTMVAALDTLHVRAFPGDLVAELKVDITSLKNLGDVLRVKDLQVPASLEVLNKPEDAVALVEMPKAEEKEVTAEEEKAAIEAVAGDKKEEGDGKEAGGKDDKKDDKDIKGKEAKSKEKEDKGKDADKKGEKK